jgi:hypothetical protein
VVFYEETQKGGASQHFDCTNFSRGIGGPCAPIDSLRTGVGSPVSRRKQVLVVCQVSLRATRFIITYYRALPLWSSRRANSHFPVPRYHRFYRYQVTAFLGEGTRLCRPAPIQPCFAC